MSTFNKTGTTSWAHIFRLLGYQVLHDAKWQKHHKNTTYMSKYDVFCDGNPTKLKLKYLYNKYPNSVFILNTRDLRGWLVSRWKNAEANKRTRRGIRDVNDETIILKWIKQRKKWYAKVYSFFNNFERRKRFV